MNPVNNQTEKYRRRQERVAKGLIERIGRSPLDDLQRQDDENTQPPETGPEESTSLVAELMAEEEENESTPAE